MAQIYVLVIYSTLHIVKIYIETFIISFVVETVTCFVFPLCLAVVVCTSSGTKPYPR